MACFSSIGGININKINSTNLKEYLLSIEKTSEDAIKNAEGTTERNYRKKVNSLNLKKKFELFIKDKRNLSEKEKYILFIKNHITELLLQIDKFAEIFKDEKLDKTSKKHRENLKKIISIMNNICEIYLIFDNGLTKKYRGDYQMKGIRNNEVRRVE